MYEHGQTLYLPKSFVHLTVICLTSVTKQSRKERRKVEQKELYKCQVTSVPLSLLLNSCHHPMKCGLITQAQAHLRTKTTV